MIMPEVGVWYCNVTIPRLRLFNNVRLIARLATQFIVFNVSLGDLTNYHRLVHVSRQKIGHMTLAKYSCEPLEMFHGSQLALLTVISRMPAS